MCAGFGVTTCTEKWDDMGSFHLPSRKLRLRHIVAAVAVAGVVLGVTIIQTATVKPSAHLTACGVDAKGPYGKFSGDHERVSVGFTYNGYWYGWGVRGSTATMIRGHWPPRVIDTSWDGGPKGTIIVPEHVVGYHVRHLAPVTRVDPPGLRLKPHFKAMMQPDDKSLIGCELHTLPSDEGD